MVFNSLEQILLSLDAIVNQIELAFDLLLKQLNLPVLSLYDPPDSLSETIKDSLDLVEAPEALTHMLHVV